MTKNNKKKKTAREKRILVGAFLTAVVIAAGSTFAWFTSSDEVTNRLSASADYEVKIVESFAPPENWIPGQDVDKDVYAVNTGNIGAYAKATVSGAMSITREVPVPLNTVKRAGDSSTTYSYTVNLWNGNDMKTGSFAETTVNSETQISFTSVTGTEGTDYPTGATFSYTIDNLTYYINNISVPTGTSNTVAGDTSISGNKDLVTLDKDERYAIEAGAYLAYMPPGDNVNKVGEQVVAYKENTNTTSYYNPSTGKTISAEAYNDLSDEEKKSYQAIQGENFTNGTDFEPHADGLYIFRRSIVVDTEGLSAGTESFKYDGYYFFGGVYYKIMNLDVTPDTETALAADGVKTDGNLSAATASLVKESKEYIENVPLTYDGANHRLVATLAGTQFDTATLTTKAQAIDAAEHELAAAELALREAMNNAGIRDANVDAAQAAYDAKVKAYNDAKDAYDAAKAAYDAAKAEYDAAVEAFNNAKNAVNADLSTTGTGIVGNNDGTVALANVDSAPAKIDNGNSDFDVDESELTLNDAGGHAIATIKNADAGSLAGAYADALTNYKTFLSNYGDTTDNENHIYNPYFAELHSGLGIDITGSTIAEKIESVLELATYEQLSTFTVTGANTEKHTFHQYVTALKLAKDNLDSSLAQYQADVATFNTTIDGLGLDTGNKIVNAETIGATTLDTILTADATSTDAKFKALADARAALDGTGVSGDTDEAKYNSITGAEVDTGGAAAALKNAEQEMNNALTALNNARTTLAGNTNVDDSLKDAQERYNKALVALNAAKANYDVADSSYANSGDIVIYINLNNDVLSGDKPEKWQILPTVVADKQAVFYYTSILGAGDVSKQLIDSVTLADTVTQYMYKYFDFDLNVKLDSAQITYDDNNKSNVTVAAANEAFDWTESNGTSKHDVTGALSPATEGGVVTWSETVTP